MPRRSLTLALLVLLGVSSLTHAAEPGSGERHLLYVVAPGIRNLLEYGGAGILVFDMDRDHSFVKRIETPASQTEKPENIKGVCACAARKRLWFTTLTRLYCVDLVTEKTLWEKALPGGTDRMSITPDGKVLYVPTLEKDHWNVVDGASGDLITRIETKSGAHNTVVSRDGSRIRAEHQPLGALERDSRGAREPRGSGAGDLQHLRSEPRRCAVPHLPDERHGRDCPRAVR